MTGASRASCGGATRSRPGIAIPVTSRWRASSPRIAAIAVLDLRLAGPDPRAEDVLPKLPDGDRVRHPVLLGRPHGDAGRALHGRGAVSRRLPARDGARR